MFGSWLRGIGTDLRTLLLQGTATTCWSLCGYVKMIWSLIKKNINSPLHVIYWLRTWVILLQVHSHDLVLAAWQQLEHVVKEFFYPGTWVTV
jgi:hypothetical protein